MDTPKTVEELDEMRAKAIYESKAMTDLTTLQSLRDRVANATGPDRGLFFDLARATCVTRTVAVFCDEDVVRVDWPEFAAFIDAKAWTDAALTWVGLVLPNSTGNMISWRQRDVGNHGWCGYWVKIVPDGERSGGACEAYAPSIALAIILSGLDALIAKEDNANGR